MTQTQTTKTVADLAENEEFSLDGGKTWHVCCTPMFGTVSVYTDDRRDLDVENVVRIDAPRDAQVLVRAPQRALLSIMG